METKVCKKCSLPKLLTEFGKKLGGQTAWCLECSRERDRDWYKNNKDSVRKRQNERYPLYAEKQMAQQKRALKSNPTNGLLKLAKQRCKKSEVPCTITKEDIIIPEFCPILGLKLEFGEMENRDNSPSLDRIIPKLGYVPGNVAVISFKANRIKNHGSSEEHRRIADWMDVQNA